MSAPSRGTDREPPTPVQLEFLAMLGRHVQAGAPPDVALNLGLIAGAATRIPEPDSVASLARLSAAAGRAAAAGWPAERPAFDAVLAELAGRLGVELTRHRAHVLPHVLPHGRRPDPAGIRPATERGT